MSQPIDLDREFRHWQDNRAEPDFSELLGGSLRWADLLTRRRVVLLAEAGSGKTTELQRQAALLRENGSETFQATLQQIGRDGFGRALGKSALCRFQQWKRCETPAWLFLDSVDEAKKHDFTFAEVLKEVSEEIEAVRGRLHIVISGRHSDWEFKRDLDSLIDLLPLPPPDDALIPVGPDEALLAAVHEERREAVDTEKPLVVVMAGLDPKRVKTFAEAKGVRDTEAMFAQLERRNLWSFARRPVDLDWLVAHWRGTGVFGSLADMLELSLKENLKETNSLRKRTDELDDEQAMRAMERIGASLVLQRLDSVAVPDPSLEMGNGVPSLKLEDVLPDWTPARRSLLLLRPVFDPAAAGFVRLHNDNAGQVRGFLAARWLRRLREQENCPWSEVSGLLFAGTYGLSLVKPSMRETAAWLSLWDRQTAQAVISRDPRLLMDAGDPGSLALNVRIDVVDAMIERSEQSGRFDIPDQDALQRFAKSDLADFIRNRWERHKGSAAVRTMLLTLIWLGEIDACAAIARDVVYGPFTDRDTKMFAGRALAKVGTTKDKRSYVVHLMSEAAKVPDILIWDALDELFPKHVSVDELLDLAKAGNTKKNSTLRLRYRGAGLAEKLPDATSASALIEAILARMSPDIEVDGAREHPDREYMTALEAAAIRLLEFSDVNAAPHAAIDAAVRVGVSQRFGGQSERREGPTLDSLLHLTAARRRTAMWQAMEVLRSHRLLRHGPIVFPVQMAHLGFDPGLCRDDLHWLIVDMGRKSNGDAIRFATNAALSVWRQDGEDPEILDAIRTAAKSPVAAAAIEDWLKPAEPSSAKQKFEREQRTREKRAKTERTTTDASWKKLANDLRRNPKQLLSLLPPSGGKIDQRLYNLWRLLAGFGTNRSRYAIEDLSPLTPILGEPVVTALREAFIQFWRHLEPTLPADRPLEERGLIYQADLIGLVGVTQEAQVAGWASKLTAKEVRAATKLATMELNGLPAWLDDLARDRPDLVGDILWTYAQSSLAADEKDEHRHNLWMLASCSDTVLATITDRVLSHLQASNHLPPAVLDPALCILRKTKRAGASFLGFALNGSTIAAEIPAKAAYLAAAFSQSPDEATDALVAAAEKLSEGDRTTLVEATLVRLLGDRHGKDIEWVGTASADTLRRLVVLAFDTITPAADTGFADGEARWVTERDEAAMARDSLLPILSRKPGPATFAALRDLRDSANLPVSGEWLGSLANQRALADSETSPWRSEDVSRFEKDFSSTPATSADLQKVGLSRLDDIDHALQHGDFSQGRAVALLPHEADVQKWFAKELFVQARSSYSLEREPHVADEKEPDIRLQSRISQASCPIEIKVAESWTLEQLETALTHQLEGLYLRHRDNRFGILLLIHQQPAKTRARHWLGQDGHLSFPDVVAHLQKIARSRSTADNFAPQTVVYAIDVSSHYPPIASPSPRKSKNIRQGRIPK